RRVRFWRRWRDEFPRSIQPILPRRPWRGHGAGERGRRRPGIPDRDRLLGCRARRGQKDFDYAAGSEPDLPGHGSSRLAADVRVPGKGNAGTMGAPAGDLYLRVEVRPHPFFERRGDDLYTTVPVTVMEATLGAKIEVPTIDGRAVVRIPPGTNSGQTLRLREK